MSEDPKSQEQKANDGIVTDAVLKAVSEQTTPDNQPTTVQLIKTLEPLFFKDILKTASDMKRMGRSLGLSGVNLDKLGDIVATAYVKGFLTHRTAMNKLDAKKLSEVYNLDWDKYQDDIIDMGLKMKKKKAKKTKANKRIESIEPKKVNEGLKGLVGDEDIDQ